MLVKITKGHVFKSKDSKAAVSHSHGAATRAIDTKRIPVEVQCKESVTVEHVQFSRTAYRNMYDQEERDIERAVRVLAKYAP